jgi:hypothetical protein
MNMFSNDNLRAIASLSVDPRFMRLLADVESARVKALNRVLSCADGELLQCRADLKALTTFINSINAAPELAKAVEQADFHAKTSNPDRVT